MLGPVSFVLFIAICVCSLVLEVLCGVGFLAFSLSFLLFLLVFRFVDPQSLRHMLFPWKYRGLFSQFEDNDLLLFSPSVFLVFVSGCLFDLLFCFRWVFRFVLSICGSFLAGVVFFFNPPLFPRWKCFHMVFIEKPFYIQS